jgi:chorismate mutase/prephenate dehydratase
MEEFCDILFLKKHLKGHNMDFKECRVEIDKINGEMLDLFVKRMNLCKLIAEYKAQNGMQTLDAEREKQVLDTITQKSPDELKRYTKEFFCAVMEISKEYQNDVMSKK